jgi:diguanylate cyclase (GGDEF)-like protein
VTEGEGEAVAGPEPGQVVERWASGDGAVESGTGLDGRSDGHDVVLVVDDEELLRESMVAVLQQLPARVVGCDGQAAAIALQRKLRPAVAVVDHRLRDGSGLELVGRLKHQDADVSVLLITGYADTASAVASVGRADAYLIKPVAPEELLRRVREALDRHRLVVENRALVDRLERLTAYQALYDPLTGLPNRALLADRLAQARLGAQRSGSDVAVFFLDLDGFKVVNDLRGHHIGDQLLGIVARRLQRAVRTSDTVARFGGDEFVVVCPQIASGAAACRVAQQLITAMRRPITVGGLEYRLTASVGIALGSGVTEDNASDVLLRNADTAMYQAKEAGGDRWDLFDQAMRDRLQRRVDLEQGLRLALERDELFLQYQPVVDLGSGRPVAAEALLRWHRPGHGVLQPVSFLPVADESGLMGAIGAWVLDRAVGELAEARSAGQVPADFRLWVNVSPHQLVDDRFAREVLALLRRFEVPASMLGVEVVEEMVSDVHCANEVLSVLQGAGVAVSIDDFGVGYSSMSRLQNLPISGLKIDRRFVAQLEDPSDEPAVAIVDAILRLARGLGLSVIAEGVETQRQADVLWSLGCPLAQGFHFAEPAMPHVLWRSVAVA